MSFNVDTNDLDPTHGQSIDLNENAGAAFPSTHIPTISSQITVEFWAKAQQPKGNTTPLRFYNSIRRREVSFHLPWGGQIYWDAGADGGGRYDRINKRVSTAELGYGTWVHWAFTKNADTGDMWIYRNGKQWHHGTGKKRKFKIQTGDLNPGGTWRGEWSELRIWSVARSEEEIAANMNRFYTDLHDHLLFRMPEQGPAGPEYGNRDSWETALTKPPLVEDLDDYADTDLVGEEQVSLGELSVSGKMGQVVADEVGPNAKMELRGPYQGTDPALSISFPKPVGGYGFNFKVDPGQWKYRVDGVNANGDTVNRVVLGATQLEGFSGFAGEQDDIVKLNVTPFHTMNLCIDNISWGTVETFNPETAPRVEFQDGQYIDTLEVGDVFGGARDKDLLSIELWVKPKGPLTGGGLLFFGTTNLPNQSGYPGANVMNFGSSWRCDGLRYMNTAKANHTFMQPDKWNHVVFTKNVAANRMAIYHNGKLITKAEGGYDREAHNTPIGLKCLRFGAIIEGTHRTPGHWSGAHFDGAMAGIRVWQREIIEEDLEVLMNTATQDLGGTLREDVLLHGPVEGELAKG